MSPILNLQRQMRTLGRIRTGDTVQRGGKRLPRQLDTFRITSQSQELVFAAAEVYGGIPHLSETPGIGWEVTTAVDALDIVVPPGQLVSQWYEMWSGGGCVRRCDGETNVLTLGPCECPSDVPTRIELAAKGEACKATTRLSVILPQIPDLGVWVIESHGYYAAVELAGAADVLAVAAGHGRLIPARLVLEKREKRVPGKPTSRYTVPVIRILEKMAEIPGLAAAAGLPALPDGVVRVPALPATTLPDASDLRPPAAGAPMPISRDHLLAGIDGLGLTRDHAIRRAGELFGQGHELDATERGQLLATLRAELEAEP